MFFTDTDSLTFMLEIETDPAIYLLCIHVGNEMYEFVYRKLDVLEDVYASSRQKILRKMHEFH